MRYVLTPTCNDGLRDASPLDIKVDSVSSLTAAVADELCDDQGEPLAVGFRLVIERVA